MLGREIDAVAMAAERQLGLRVELQPVVQKALGEAELKELRARAALGGEPVVGDCEAGARCEIAAAIFDQGAAGGPARAAAEIVLVGSPGTELEFAL